MCVQRGGTFAPRVSQKDRPYNKHYTSKTYMMQVRKAMDEQKLNYSYLGNFNHNYCHHFTY